MLPKYNVTVPIACKIPPVKIFNEGQRVHLGNSAGYDGFIEIARCGSEL